MTRDFSRVCLADELVVSNPNPEISRLYWMELIRTWAEDHNVEITWQGEWTHKDHQGITDYSIWQIAKPRDRIMFLLKWG